MLMIMAQFKGHHSNNDDDDDDDDESGGGGGGGVAGGVGNVSMPNPAHLVRLTTHNNTPTLSAYQRTLSIHYTPTLSE